MQPEGKSPSTKVGELFKVVGGGTPSTANPDFWNGSVPWVTSADLDDHLHVNLRKSVSREAIAASATNLVPGGSVIVATRVGLGKVGIAETELCFSQDCQGIILDPQVCDSTFAALQLKIKVQVFKHISRGTTIAGVTKKQLLDLPFDLPSLDEQRETVAEIEKQFTRLEAGVAGLRRVQANLKRYRAAVLKAACEGKLVPTEAELARQAGRGYETGAQLLECILTERRQKWNGKGKYKEPIVPERTNLPELPEGWMGATADQSTSVITDGEHITPQRTNAGVLLLSARNILDGRISIDDVDFVPQHEYERIAKRLVIYPGDVLLSCSGTVGRSAVAPEGLTFTLVRSVAVLKPLAGMGKYLSITLRSPFLKSQILQKQTQTAQANIFQGKIKTLIVPLPPLPEQQRIVAEVERSLSVVEGLEAVANANLQRATRLRQSILQRAFEGN